RAPFAARRELVPRARGRGAPRGLGRRRLAVLRGAAAVSFAAADLGVRRMGSRDRRRDEREQPLGGGGRGRRRAAAPRDRASAAGPRTATRRPRGPPVATSARSNRLLALRRAVPMCARAVRALIRDGALAPASPPAQGEPPASSAPTPATVFRLAATVIGNV